MASSDPMPRPTARHAATPSAYGYRAKIGVIVPPTNTVNEAEWNRMAPEGISIHATRMPLHADTSSPDGKKSLYDDVAKATKDLAQAQLDAIAYGCTAGSMVLPITELSGFMSGIVGRPCVTTAASIVNALKALSISKVALATPYHQALNDHEIEFLARSGIEVVHAQGLGIGGGGVQEYIQIAQTPESAILDHILSADRPEADAIIVSCTDFPVLNLIPDIEHRLSKPIVTSNQATFWAVLRAAGIDDRLSGMGALLAQ